MTEGPIIRHSPESGDSGESEIVPAGLAGGVSAQSGDRDFEKAKFGPLGERATRDSESRGNIDLLLDVPLPVSVELGRTTMAIRDILDLGPGSVVEVDRVAGEPVDILVNGRLVARGEVVVIDENFGVRIVDIVSPAERVACGDG